MDDERAITDNLAPFLEGSAVETSVASDGEQTPEKFAAGKPDLVVMDVLIPGWMGGRRSAAGSGLGPALVRAIVSRHGGQTDEGGSYGTRSALR